jgi:hypothetical protein
VTPAARAYACCRSIAAKGNCPPVAGPIHFEWLKTTTAA